MIYTAIKLMPHKSRSKVETQESSLKKLVAPRKLISNALCPKILLIRTPELQTQTSTKVTQYLAGLPVVTAPSFLNNEKKTKRTR